MFLFKFSNSGIIARPYVKCIGGKNETLIYFVFETIAKEFITVHERRAHEQASLALSILTEVFTNIKKDFLKLNIFIKSISECVLLHAMLVDDYPMAPSRRIAFDLLKEMLQFDGIRQCEQLR